MKLSSKFLALGLLAAASTFAHATTLTGNIFMSSTNGFQDTVTTTGITFSPTGTGAERIRNGTGDFASLGTDLVDLTNITFANISTSTPQQIFTFTDGTASNVFTFDATSFRANSNSTSFQFSGLLFENNALINSTSLFNLTNSDTFELQTPDAFSSSDSNVAPEPNSLILLGTGFMSAAGVVMRKRRKLVA